MKLNHFILGVFITIIWGANFSVIKIGLENISPYSLASLRFLLCAFPLVFVIKKPTIKTSYIVSYGFFLGVFQFGFLFTGIYLGVSAGVASILLQLQVFFTIALSSFIFKEKVKMNQILGMLVAFAGLLLLTNIAHELNFILGLILIALAALSWGVANIIIKKSNNSDVMGLLVWSSLIPPIPLIIFEIMINGTNTLFSTISNISLTGVGALLYLVYPTTLLGFTVWNSLLVKYQASKVAPLTLLVPIFGVLFSIVIFDEKLTLSKIIAIILVFLGLLINQFGFLIMKRK